MTHVKDRDWKALSQYMTAMKERDRLREANKKLRLEVKSLKRVVEVLRNDY
jgi:hypothetical protein